MRDQHQNSTLFFNHAAVNFPKELIANDADACILFN